MHKVTCNGHQPVEFDVETPEMAATEMAAYLAYNKKLTWNNRDPEVEVDGVPYRVTILGGEYIAERNYRDKLAQLVSVLQQLKTDYSGHPDPTQNRKRMVHPGMLAAKFRVSEETIDLLMSVLYSLGIVNKWHRLICPISDDEDIIAEVRHMADWDPDEHCPHCGRIHDEDDPDSAAIEDAFYVLGDFGT